MESLKYKIIKTLEQYKNYCSTLENLKKDSTGNQDEIELLNLLIDKWDQDHYTFEDMNPIELLRYLMAEHNLKSKDLGAILKLSKGLLSDILNCKKGLSKASIRTLSTYFNISQEAFNRPYVINAVKRKRPSVG